MSSSTGIYQQFIFKSITYFNMQNDLSLDDLITKDKEDRKKNREERRPPRTKLIEKRHRKQGQGNRGHHDNHHDRNQRRQERSRVQDRFQERPRKDKQQARGYNLLVKGFVADVSTEDIFKLLKGKKVQKISTFLEKDGQTIGYQKEMPIDVKIRFVEKEDAQSFMQEYSSKLLDGKHNLTFTFVRA